MDPEEAAQAENKLVSGADMVYVAKGVIPVVGLQVEIYPIDQQESLLLPACFDLLMFVRMC